MASFFDQSFLLDFEPFEIQRPPNPGQENIPLSGTDFAFFKGKVH
jgi:hypothetical protein